MSNSEEAPKHFRFGLIGCGRISKRHIQVLSEIPQAEIVAVCDLNAEKARAAAEVTGGRPYTRVEEMLKAEELDVASVLTESGSHARVAMEAAPFVSALVLEKPMTLSLDDADRLIETCDQTQTRLFVVKQNRYNPPVQRLRRALEDGRFGKMVMGTVRVRWSRDQRTTTRLPGGAPGEMTAASSPTRPATTWISSSG